jgi:hypothetical protein
MWIGPEIFPKLSWKSSALAKGWFLAKNGFFGDFQRAGGPASIQLPSIISQDGKLCLIHRGPIAMSGPRRLAVHSDSISTAPRTPVA